MLSEVTLEAVVPISTRYLQSKEVINLRSLLATSLLKTMVCFKSSQAHGYYLTVTSIKCTEEEETFETSPTFTFFPIKVTCRSFKPCVGETMLGVVYGILEKGALLRSGPIQYIFLSRQMLGENFNFVPGENAAFVDNSLSRIEVDVVVRFRVFYVIWVKKEHEIEREFQVFASLEGESLGPVSHSGPDELDLLF